MRDFRLKSVEKLGMSHDWILLDEVERQSKSQNELKDNLIEVWHEIELPTLD